MPYYLLVWQTNAIRKAFAMLEIRLITREKGKIVKSEKPFQFLIRVFRRIPANHPLDEICRFDRKIKREFKQEQKRYKRDYEKWSQGFDIGMGIGKLYDTHQTLIQELSKR